MPKKVSFKKLFAFNCSTNKKVLSEKEKDKTVNQLKERGKKIKKKILSICIYLDIVGFIQKRKDNPLKKKRKIRCTFVKSESRGQGKRWEEGKR